MGENANPCVDELQALVERPCEHEHVAHVLHLRVPPQPLVEGSRAAEHVGHADHTQPWGLVADGCRNLERRAPFASPTCAGMANKKWRNFVPTTVRMNLHT